VMLGATYCLTDARIFTNEFMGIRTGGGTPPGGGGGNTTTVTVTKVWVTTQEHPESVMVQLYRDGTPYGSSVILNAGNNWSYRWTGLNRYYTWTVDELAPPSGYTKTVTGNALDGFRITNTQQKHDDPPPTPTPPVTVEVPPGTPPVTEETPPTDPTPPGTPNQHKPPEPEPPRPGRPGNPPKTGDDADPRPWLILLAVSAFVLRRILFFRKNQDKEGRR